MEGARILGPPESVQQPDYLLMESTYGNRQRVETEDRTEQLFRILERTLDRGGKVVIPSFAVGRAQEVMARIRTYGHVNRRLCRVQLEGETVPAIGAEIRNGDDDGSGSPLGRVTSATATPDGGHAVALGFVRYRSAEPKTVISIDGAGPGVIDLVIGG